MKKLYFENYTICTLFNLCIIYTIYISYYIHFPVEVLADFFHSVFQPEPFGPLPKDCYTQRSKVLPEKLKVIYFLIISWTMNCWCTLKVLPSY